MFLHQSHISGGYIGYILYGHFSLSKCRLLLQKLIPYLKFDIETSEWKVLQNLLSDGSLKNVMQLAFEIHVDTWAKAKDYFQLIKGLETLGFHRWYCNRRFGRFLFQSDQAYINVKYISHY